MGKFGLKHLFVLFCLLYVVSCREYSNNYHFVHGTLPATQGQPAQTTLGGDVPLPACCKGPYCWKFTPLFSYAITGLVFGVSHKLSSKFGDVISSDLGLLWGENSRRELYRGVKLLVMMDHYDVYIPDKAEFDLNAASNNHIATCDPAVFSRIRQIRPGDQVRLRGWLVNAKISKDPGETDPSRIMTWNSSVRRDDQGEGACELLYIPSVSDIELLAAAPAYWLWLERLGLLGMLITASLAWHRWQLQLKKDLDDTKKIDF